MKLDTLIRGDLVLPDRVLTDGWLGIAGQKIAGVFKAGEAPAAGRMIDHRGRLVFPGGFDPHVHAYSAGPDFEGLGRLTRGAAAGGITTIMDMPYDSPEPLTHIDRLESKLEKIRREAVVDVALYGTIAKHGGSGQIVPLCEAGIRAFKFSTYEADPDRFVKIPDHELTLAFQELRAAGRVAVFHAENGEIIDPLIESLYEQGKAQPQAHCWSRPPASETTAVLHLLELARNFPVKLHFAHLTVPFAYDAIRWYRRLGVDVTAETCIQYLLLDESHLSTLRGGAKCNPPMRSKAIREALWEKLFAGEIAFVVSDHAPWPDSDKSAPNIFDNKSGLPGVELLLPLLFSEAVAARGMGLLQFNELIAAGAAKRFGLYPQKGALVPGSDADLCILDPHQKWVVRGQACQTAAKISPYEGMSVTGRVVSTFVRGREVIDGQEVVAPAGHGRYLPYAGDSAG